jgi:serine/threonine-protein phosphatase 2B catalytic subunit
MDKYNSVDLYDKFMETFEHLPIAAEVASGKSGNYLCMHGGISPHLQSRSDIDKFDRFKQPPAKGLFKDILWSDPIDSDEEDSATHTFMTNKTRKCG